MATSSVDGLARPRDMRNRGSRPSVAEKSVRRRPPAGRAWRARARRRSTPGIPATRWRRRARRRRLRRRERRSCRAIAAQALPAAMPHGRIVHARRGALLHAASGTVRLRRAAQRVGARLVGQAPDRDARARQRSRARRRAGAAPSCGARRCWPRRRRAAASVDRPVGAQASRGTRRRAPACRRRTRRRARVGRGPMRVSVFRPRSTSLASAPTLSQSAAISLMKVTDVARNALIACFVISADSTDIHSMRVGERREQLLRCAARSRSSAMPTTTRSGCVKTSIALPRRRFSGEHGKRTRRRGRPRLPRGARARDGADRQLRRHEHERRRRSNRGSSVDHLIDDESTSARSSSSTGVSNVIQTTSASCTASVDRSRIGGARIETGVERASRVPARRPAAAPAQSGDDRRVGIPAGDVVASRRRAGRDHRAEMPQPERPRRSRARLEQLRIRAQIVERAEDAFSNRQLRRPSERADLASSRER